MGILKGISGDSGMERMIEERDRLLDEAIPRLQEAVRSNPTNGVFRRELAQALALRGRLDEAKAESDAAMLLLPASERQSVLDLQHEIAKMVGRRDSGL